MAQEVTKWGQKESEREIGRDRMSGRATEGLWGGKTRKTIKESINVCMRATDCVHKWLR